MGILKGRPEVGEVLSTGLSGQRTVQPEAPESTTYKGPMAGGLECSGNSEETSPATANELRADRELDHTYT